MEDQRQQDTRNPAEGLIPLTPQARRLGFPIPVYASKTVWKRFVLGEGKNTTDSSILNILTSLYQGMSNAAAREEECVHITFKHWFWPKNKPRATKQKSVRLGARIFLQDENTPWMLLFHPLSDTAEDIFRD